MKLLAAIQAGGRSRRMGADKAWLDVQGQPMIARVIAAAQPLAQRLAIVISQTTPEPERYAKLAKRWQAELLIDAYDQRGPLGGIAMALQNCQANESSLILACDLPFLTSEFLRLLIASHSALRTPHSALDEAPHLTVPEDQTGRLQMLCGVYDPACLPFAQKLLAENKLRVDGLCELVETQRLHWADYAGLTAAEGLLLNCNSLNDLPKR